MAIIDVLKEKAKADKKTIVLPESEDRRTYEAAAKILKEGIADIILVGSEEDVKKNGEGLDLTGIKVVDPATSDRTAAYIDKLVELRSKKGMTPEQAKEILLNQYLYYGVMMVKMGDADGMVSGACHSTADTLRPCLQILKTKPGTKLVSAFFLMEVPNCEFGENGTFVFADCGLNQDPTSGRTGSDRSIFRRVFPFPRRCRAEGSIPFPFYKGKRKACTGRQSSRGNKDRKRAEPGSQTRRRDAA